MNKTVNVTMVLFAIQLTELASVNPAMLERTVKINVQLENMEEIVPIIALVKMVLIVLIPQAIVRVLQVGVASTATSLVNSACMACSVKTSASVRMELPVILSLASAAAQLDTLEITVSRSANMNHMG